MPAVLAAVVLAALYLVLDPPSLDLAAQTYRVGLFDHHGWLAWDNGWYGGHHLPGYSVLFPPLASALGLHVVAALSIVGATAAFQALARRLFAVPAAATASSLWFAVAMTALVVSGRLAFALGAAIGVAAALALAAGRAWAAAALGALTALASPVAALFLALAGGSWWLVRRERAALAMTAVTVATGAVLVLLFPEGGTEPFVASAFWPALAAALIAAALTDGAVRVGALVYAVVLVAAFALDTPLGGNAARLGALLGGPLAVGLLWDRGRVVLAAVCLPLAYWVLYPPIRDWSQAAGDPARAASYYTPLLAQLNSDGPVRVEIPFTAGHWEAARVPGGRGPVLLARGWERQLDRKVNALFYDGPLTADRYAAWLHDNAIRWVALPDAPLDHSAAAEAALIRSGLPFLRETWHDAHWRLYAVRDPRPLGASALGPDWFVTTGGLVRVRWSPYWTVVAGRGCVREGPGGWTAVAPAPRGSTVRVAIRVSPFAALSHGARCR